MLLAFLLPIEPLTLGFAILLLRVYLLTQRVGPLRDMLLVLPLFYAQAARLAYTLEAPITSLHPERIPALLISVVCTSATLLLWDTPPIPPGEFPRRCVATCLGVLVVFTQSVEVGALWTAL